MEIIFKFFQLIFGICVAFLYYLGGLLGMDYIEINYWLFVILLPIILITTFALNLYYIIKFLITKIN